MSFLSKTKASFFGRVDPKLDGAAMDW